MTDPLDRSIWQQAVSGYWTHLTTQQENQGALSGIKDTGNRAAVTGGKQMDLMQAVVADLWMSDPEIHFEVRTTGHNNLPTYFRPSKNWDLVVLYRGALIAAMEFKSQRGPSFGNNFNNRTEEALGLAADSQMAVERGLFGTLKPWFGFIMLVERASGSTRPVRVPSNMPFPADPIFEGESYIGRYRIFFERMIAEGNYDAVALLTAEANSGEYEEPSPALSMANLEAAIKARIAYIKALPDDQFDAMVQR
ncbi:PaeR7I family type II restriction endonuclease [Pseudoglutamicibacter albus]|uniref:PaeR7I family type II restriction endonuclease n=1 Tax=Pseudoglutamicibacter cumminsii TaxID=156979 RepID=A0AAP4FD41_9MICC|nr:MULTISPECIES: PaeR7I family type II restriction endonuclease [Pseudoglutamicibacter]MDK6274409.1 PaeR7I family type II restriction endonuclease [Pseudoglutamicibacter cumminsii]PKY81164.1 type II restriction endonuclease [Pseudoglutamicibacter albus]WIK84183.1 PaeR7I family type II restriction endonuclease [Pseudoglutamicibacter albus]